jgi:hypothetical protein
MATRIAGRNGRLYAAATEAGAAVPVAFLNSWAISFATDKIEVTAFGDPNKVYVGGLPDASGTYAGFLDADAPQFYAAATDGLARRFYLYPNTSTTTNYWYGSALFDFNVDGTVEGAVTINGSWSAATTVSMKP